MTALIHLQLREIEVSRFFNGRQCAFSEQNHFLDLTWLFGLDLKLGRTVGFSCHSCKLETILGIHSFPLNFPQEVGTPTLPSWGGCPDVFYFHLSAVYLNDCAISCSIPSSHCFLCYQQHMTFCMPIREIFYLICPLTNSTKNKILICNSFLSLLFYPSCQYYSCLSCNFHSLKLSCVRLEVCSFLFVIPVLLKHLPLLNAIPHFT